jgi:DNA helicase-2/ATP-dependent DNA helicase PcrA
LRRAAITAIDRYFDRHGGDLTRTIHSEKKVEVQIAPGVTVDGRIDLIKSLETGETAIVDFKSTEDSQAESVTKDQLSIYALGYQELTGAPADRIQILNLDDHGKSSNDPVNANLMSAIKAKVEAVAVEIRASRFECPHDHSSEAAYDDLAWMTKR